MTDEQLKETCRQAWAAGLSPDTPGTFEEWWATRAGTEVDVLAPESDAEILAGIQEIRITYLIGDGQITYTVGRGDVEAAQRIRWDDNRAILQLGIRNAKYVRRSGVSSRTYDIDEVFPR